MPRPTKPYGMIDYSYTTLTDEEKSRWSEEKQREEHIKRLADRAAKKARQEVYDRFKPIPPYYDNHEPGR